MPRNWQPPPGDAQARHPRSAACSSVKSPCTNRTPMDCTRPASSAAIGSSVTPPGTSTHGRSCVAASAIIIAGSPLSQVAIPSTPRRVGSERMRRRKTVAASLRYGRLSNIAGVPESARRTGRYTKRRTESFPRERIHRRPLPSAGRLPSDRCDNQGRSAFHPVRGFHRGSRASGTPALRVSRRSSPCRRSASSRTRSPDGRSLSICGVSGSEPTGPAACVETSKSAGS